jgi:hypothetical protein
VQQAPRCIISADRAFISRSRTRCSTCRSCCATDLTATQCLVGRVIASAMASVARRAFVCAFLYGVTHCGSHQRDRIAMVPHAARPIMGAATGFHTNTRRGARRNTPHYLRTVEPLTHEHRAVRIHPHEGKRLCCTVDAEDAQRLLHGTRLLLVHDFP